MVKTLSLNPIDFHHFHLTLGLTFTRPSWNVTTVRKKITDSSHEQCSKPRLVVLDRGLYYPVI